MRDAELTQSSTASQIFLDYMLFMQEWVTSFINRVRGGKDIVLGRAQASDGLRLTSGRLMREASIRSRKAGEKNISPNAVRKVTEVCGRWRSFLVMMILTVWFAIADTAEVQRLIGRTLS